MELRQLRYFTVLAETLNFHRAADRLNISQPPLTVAIRKLEEELGARLFDRGGRGVRLTDAGRLALVPAREALAQAQLVHESIRQSTQGQRGRLAIGFVGSAVAALLPRIIPAFRAQFPQVELVLEENTSSAIAGQIESREIDVGLVRLPLMRPVDLDLRVVQRDVLVAAIPSGNPLAQRRRITLGELAGHPFIIHGPVSVLYTAIILACQTAGFMPQIAQEANQIQTILSLVQSGLGVALVPAGITRFVPDGVRLIPLDDPIAIDMGLACRVDAGSLARNFIEVALASSDSLSISDQ